MVAFVLAGSIGSLHITRRRTRDGTARGEDDMVREFFGCGAVMLTSAARKATAHSFWPFLQ
jgi:hypothetical protein